jgi:hypothetical protein
MALLIVAGDVAHTCAFATGNLPLSGKGKMKKMINGINKSRAIKH